MVASTTSGSGAGIVVHQIDDPDPQAVADYWTPERMRSAHPVELLNASSVNRRAPRSTSRLPSWLQSFGQGHWTGSIGPFAMAIHPHTSIGKVFFTLRGFDFVCSASAVSSRGRWGEGSRNLIVTAGHCVSDGGGTFVSKLTFVPGYFDGNAPFGRWPAETVSTTSAWHFGLGRAFSRDVAFLGLTAGTRQHAGSDLHDVVDPLGIAFTERYRKDGLRSAVKPRVGTRYASLGYGVQNWGGEDQVLTLSRVATLDQNFLPSPIGMPSTHTGGSSGGPWLYNYVPTVVDQRQRNLVNSVNAYKYFGVEQMYGPQFDDQIHTLWEVAATQ